MDISEIRREYQYAGLTKADLHSDPVSQFEQWFCEARDNALNTPNALSLATVDANGMPRVRTVLLKAFDHDGFVFYTNYHSAKAHDLAQNPQAAMLFHWLEFDRQVEVQGRVSKVSAEESSRYFHSRPRSSQLAAWCSAQSTPIRSRSTLLEAFATQQARFAEGEIPLPDFWGGYRLQPQRIAFWQGRENRLHDRFEYLRVDDTWHIQRLAP